MAQAALPTGGENTAAAPRATTNLITTKMAAQRLGVTPKTIRAWFNTGYIWGQRVTPSLIVVARERIDETLNRLPPLPA